MQNKQGSGKGFRGNKQIKNSTPLDYCSSTQNPNGGAVSTMGIPGQLSFSFEIINATGSDILVTDRANVVYSIPSHDKVVRSNKIIVRRLCQMSITNNEGASIRHTEMMVEGQGFETIEARRMIESVKKTLNFGDVASTKRHYVMEYEIPMDTLHDNRAIHHLESDLVFTAEIEPYSHPSSENSRRQRAMRTVFTEPGVSGMTVEIVDNHNQYGPRYICMGGQAVEVKPHRDTTREHGVHITVMMVTPDGDIRPKVTVVSMDDAKEQYGLFSTREDAVNWGRTDLALAIELDSIRSSMKAEELRHAQERAVLQREQEAREVEHREEMRRLELEHANTKRELEHSASIQETAAKLTSKVTDFKLDKKKEKGKLSWKRRKRKES